MTVIVFGPMTKAIGVLELPLVTTALLTNTEALALAVSGVRVIEEVAFVTVTEYVVVPDANTGLSVPELSVIPARSALVDADVRFTLIV